MASRKHCFLYTPGKRHIWAHTDCDSVHKACTSPSQISILVVCVCDYMCTCFHMHHGVLVGARGRLLRTGPLSPACFHPGLNSGLRLGSRRFYPQKPLHLSKKCSCGSLSSWHCVHRKVGEYTLQLDVQMPWCHFYSNNELGLLLATLGFEPQCRFPVGNHRNTNF